MMKVLILVLNKGGYFLATLCFILLLICHGCQFFPDVFSDYDKVRDKPLARQGYPDAVIQSELGNIYILYDEFASVNVYNKDKEFLYAYKVPDRGHGSVEYAVDEPYVYIKNAKDIIYVYKNDTFVEKVTDNDFNKIKEIDFIDENNEIKGYPELIKTNLKSFEKLYYIGCILGAFLIGISMVMRKSL